jgi:predicted PurR-regulated permease PerM
MLLGIALTAALQGLVVGVAFWLVELPQPLFWALITAFVSVLPVFGSALVWLPGTIVLVADGRYGAALALLAIGAGIASNIDNVIRPMVYRRVSHIHPMTTVVGAFAGVAQFGVIGVLLGPLAISYFFELVRMYRLEYGTVEGGVASLPAPSGAGTTVATAEPGALAT